MKTGPTLQQPQTLFKPNEMVKFNILYNSGQGQGGGHGYRWDVPKQNWAGDALIG